MSFDLKMIRALEADGEKLRQLTGEDHGPAWIDTPEDVRFREVRDMAFSIIRDSVKCAEIDRLNAGCERANCGCADAACAIAANIAWPTTD